MSEIVARLGAVIADRHARPREGSYTCELLAAGRPQILKKVGEEASEVLVAGALQGPERLAEEVADLVYHLLVLLEDAKLSWADVEAVLEARHRPTAPQG